MPLAAAIGKGSIVEATAHAQTIASRIKPDQRQQYQLQTPSLDLASAICAWLANAEPIALPALSLYQSLKRHSGCRPALKYRQIAVLAIAASQLQ